MVRNPRIWYPPVPSDPPASPMNASDEQYGMYTLFAPESGVCAGSASNTPVFAHRAG